MGPGRPLMVCASDMFGGNPDCVAWFITASTSVFHHSPTITYFLGMFSKNIKIIIIIKKLRAK